MFKKILFVGLSIFVFYSYLFSQPVEDFGNYNYLYSGSIDKYNISIVLCSFGYGNKETTELFGYYYYNKNKIPIFLKGNKMKDEITLNEYLDNGKVNGTFKLKESKTLDCTGTWDNGKKKLNVKLSKISVAVEDDEKLPTIEKLDTILPPIKKKTTFTKKTNNTSGDLVISEKKAKYVEYYFNFSLVNESNAHIGELEGKLENNGSIFYYDSNSKADYSKGFDDGTILFFIFFKDKVFVYQYGSEANLDFGQGVIGEGVYVILD